MQEFIVKEGYPLEKVAPGLWVVKVPDVKRDFFEVRDIFKRKQNGHNPIRHS